MSEREYQTPSVPGKSGLQADGSFILDDTFEYEMDLLAKLDREDAEEARRAEDEGPIQES